MNELRDIRRNDGFYNMYKYVMEVLEKYPVPYAKIEKVSFYGDPNVNKMSKNKLIKYLYRIPSMKRYWFYFATLNVEYHFHLENKMDLVQKFDKTIVANLLKEVEKLYQDGKRYIFDDFSKKVRMSEQRNINLCRGEKIVPFSKLSTFINTKLNQIIRYHLITNLYLFGLLEFDCV